MSISDLILKQYESNKVTTGGNEKKMSDDERMKKYFTTALPAKGPKTGEKRIRIIPTKEGSPFVEVLLHEMKVGDNWMKLYDPAQEGLPSPLNDVYQGLRLSGDPQDKEMSKQYRSKKFYIVKVIDRDNEADGPKFWRFKHNFKNDGIFDKIVPLFRTKGDITDQNEGRDLILTLNLVKANNGNEYTQVTSIIPDDKSPLHENKETADEWIADELVWTDVYSKKSTEYLTIVANGKTPKWSQELSKWTSYEDLENKNYSEEVTMGSTNVVDNQPTNDGGDDEDLPF